jgi:hypothetical protein
MGKYLVQVTMPEPGRPETLVLAVDGADRFRRLLGRLEPAKQSQFVPAICAHLIWHLVNQMADRLNAKAASSWITALGAVRKTGSP